MPKVSPEKNQNWSSILVSKLSRTCPCEHKIEEVKNILLIKKGTGCHSLQRRLNLIKTQTKCTILLIYENLGLRVAEWLLHVLHSSVKNNLLTLAEIQHELFCLSACVYFSICVSFMFSFSLSLYGSLYACFCFCLYAVTFYEICVYS